MVKVVQGVRFEPEEIRLITEYAEFAGKSFSTVVREATMSVIEDRIDTEELRKAIAEESASNSGASIGSGSGASIGSGSGASSGSGSGSGSAFATSPGSGSAFATSPGSSPSSSPNASGISSGQGYTLRALEKEFL